MPRHAALALCLSLSFAVLAAESTPPAPERVPASERSQDLASGLQRRLPEAEQQRLQAGKESFLALWLPANTAEAQGVVILVPGEGESADWPVAIGPLRRKLPDAGWSTLSLSLPDPQSTAPVPRPTASSDKAGADADASGADSASRPQVEGSSGATPPAESTAEVGSGEPAQASPEPAPRPIDPQEQRKAHAERVMARIQAGIDQALQHKPRSVVLLGHGSGAYWAARYLAEREPGEVRNLLLVAGDVPPDFLPPLESMVSRLPLAIGDFYYQDDDAAHAAALLRRQAEKRERHPAYTQVGLNTQRANPEAEQEQLYRRVRGWLEKHRQEGAGG
ncbi:hypothetical protein D3C76_751200 [compost metagenome]|uniref:KaiA N-terminal domain-containing protein n=1 Tax=Pseudomonas jinjuensis TaxID=198616 RepID=A0A1H0IZT5_9PSED|nr:alpha/beta hydrolase family protein [Pseudomonas jinjuensis]SDO36842.1 Protein of unknown function [Pseudomonas jinjuensis]